MDLGFAAFFNFLTPNIQVSCLTDGIDKPTSNKIQVSCPYIFMKASLQNTKSVASIRSIQYGRHDAFPLSSVHSFIQLRHCSLQLVKAFKYSI